MTVELMDDGYKISIAFGTSTITMFQIETGTPPSISGGGAKSTTTHSNTAWRTKAPKHLKEAGPMNLTVQYDPQLIDEIMDSLQVNQSITVTFPNGDTLVVWGWLEEFSPGEMAEGEVPTADIVIEISNRNGSGVETGPVWAAAV